MSRPPTPKRAPGNERAPAPGESRLHLLLLHRDRHQPLQARARRQPSIGAVGRLESVPEERIEVVCAATVLGQAIEAIKAVHPYEEMALDIYPLKEPRRSHGIAG